MSTEQNFDNMSEDTFPEGFHEAMSTNDLPEMIEKEIVDFDAPEGLEVSTDLETDLELDNKDDKSTKEPVIENKPDSNSGDEDSPFKIIAEQFKGKLFEEDDFKGEDFEFDGSEDSFYKLFERKLEKEIFNNLSEIINQLPEKFQTPIKNYINGLDYETSVQTGDQLSLYKVDAEVLKEDTAKAETIYRNYLREKGFSENKIEKLVTQAKELDELADEAIDASKEMVTLIEKQIENKKKEADQKMKDQQREVFEKVEKFRNDVMERKDIFGLAVSEKLKKELVEDMTTPSIELPDGRKVTKIQAAIAKDPQSFNLLLNYYNKIGLFNYDEKSKTFKPDLSRIKTEKISDKLHTQVDKMKQAANKFKGGYSIHDPEVDKNSQNIVESLKKFVLNT